MNKFLTISRRSHRYFSMISNFATWTVITVLLVLHFNTHLELVMTNYLNNANLRAGILAGWASDIDWSQQGAGNNLTEDLSQRILTYGSLFGGSDSNIVSLKISILNQKNSAEESVFSLNQGHSSMLSDLERQVSALVMTQFLNENLVRFDDQGFWVDGESDFRLGNKNMKLAISLDADKFIWDQTKGVLALLLILLMIAIVLVLRHRLFLIGVQRAFLGDYLDRDLIYGDSLKVRLDYQAAMRGSNGAQDSIDLNGQILSGDEGAVFEVYKDVMYAVSQGKIILVKEDELQTYIDCGVHLLDMRLQNPADVPLARDVSRRFISNLFPYYEAVKKALISVSEAATNAYLTSPRLRRVY